MNDFTSSSVLSVEPSSTISQINLDECWWHKLLNKSSRQ